MSDPTASVRISSSRAPPKLVPVANPSIPGGHILDLGIGDEEEIEFAPVQGRPMAAIPDSGNDEQDMYLRAEERNGNGDALDLIAQKKSAQSYVLQRATSSNADKAQMSGVEMPRSISTQSRAVEAVYSPSPPVNTPIPEPPPLTSASNPPPPNFSFPEPPPTNMPPSNLDIPLPPPPLSVNEASIPIPPPLSIDPPPPVNSAAVAKKMDLPEPSSDRCKLLP